MAIERNHSIASPQTQTDDTDNQNQIDQILRPKTLEEYVGQKKIKNHLKIFISAAIKRNEPLEHLLLYGPPGLGKTTLANIIANETNANIRITSGPAIEKQGDLASILSNLKEGDILFIDEIHRLKTNIEEILYSAMEDFALDLIVGKGPGARSMRLALPKFTLIGATTKAGSLSSPLRDRFGVIHKLDFYETDEIGQIIDRSASILETKITPEACLTLAGRARFTPRIANRILKRLRDYAEVIHQGEITHNIAMEGLETLGIDPHGLDHTDRFILETIVDKFEGGPVGLSTLAAATAEAKETIEDIYEPFLLQLGFLARTPRGRVATRKAYKHMGFEFDEDKQASFF